MKNLFLLIISVVFILLSCNQRKETTNIGIMLPLTGDLAKYGQSGYEGMDVALKLFRNKSDFQFQTILEDDKGTVAGGINAINKLIYANDVDVIIGSMSSGITLGIAPIAEENKIVLMAPTSTASAVTNAGEYVFRVCVSDEFEGAAMAKFIEDSLTYNKLGCIYINNDYGKGLAENFLNSINKDKVEILVESYDPKTINFRPVVQKMKEQKIDILYIVAQKEQEYFFKACKELNFSPQFTGSTMIEDKELFNRFSDFLKGTYYTYRSYDPAANIKEVQEFVSTYEVVNGRKPDFYAASVFDAVTAILVATEAVTERDDSISLKDYLYIMKPIRGITGEISFDKNGDVKQGFSIRRI